jgi:hypothetical protein
MVGSWCVHVVVISLRRSTKVLEKRGVFLIFNDYVCDQGNSQNVVAQFISLMGGRVYWTIESDKAGNYVNALN